MNITTALNSIPDPPGMHDGRIELPPPVDLIGRAALHGTEQSLGDHGLHHGLAVVVVKVIIVVDGLVVAEVLHSSLDFDRVLADGKVPLFLPRPRLHGPHRLRLPLNHDDVIQALVAAVELLATVDGALVPVAVNRSCLVIVFPPFNLSMREW